jgi:hypothetical protein
VDGGQHRCPFQAVNGGGDGPVSLLYISHILVILGRMCAVQMAPTAERQAHRARHVPHTFGQLMGASNGRAGGAHRYQTFPIPMSSWARAIP